jgi:hypothetical protein
MVVMARAQPASRATARVARTRTRSRSIPSRVLVRATLAVALGARSRDLFSQLSTSYLDVYGMGASTIPTEWGMVTQDVSIHRSIGSRDAPTG